MGVLFGGASGWSEIERLSREVVMQSVGEVVRQRREALGWTLSELAARVRTTKSYLSMIENHRVSNPPSRALLDGLEQALELEEGTLQAAAGWQAATVEVREQFAQLAEQARLGQELASWLAENTSRSAGGGKNLDRLYRSGKLRRRINEALGEEGAVKGEGVKSGPMVRGRVPLINKVAAGYPTGFTDLDYPARVADGYMSCPSVEDPDAFAATVVGASMEPAYREGDIVVFSPLAEVVSGCDCFVRIEPDHETTFKRVYLDESGKGSIRLQPVNPQFAPQVLDREQVSGLYRAVWRMSPV